jgi:starch synthase (maltosyl-transferring)
MSTRPRVVAPGLRPAAEPAARVPRVLIEGIAPAVDGGRWAAKRVVGDVLRIGADILKDGHDLVAARACWRGPGDDAWRYVPMAYDDPSDRWSAEVTLERVGRVAFTVEAWPDHVGTWATELEKRIAAGQEVEAELQEGAALLDAVATRARGDDRPALAGAAAQLRNTKLALAQRTAPALSPSARALAASLPDDAEITRHAGEATVVVDRARARFASWYEMFPRSQAAEPGRHGTFADAARALVRVADLGFDVVYLPPIHPIGRTHRKGPNNSLVCGPDDPGSPWAIGNEDGGHTAVEPALGTLADFDRFVAEAERLGLEIALDYALQCSPDHPWVREHPDWFFVRADGSIRYAENPPKKYQDIYPLNFWCADRQGLWRACRDVVLFWIGHGVHTFRVDNPHTKPFAFWEWLLADVRAKHPDTVFLAEAFTRPKRMKALAKIGFTQNYTYFTWRNAAWELREYLTELTQTDMAEYFRGNLFANTPDILHEYLQTGGRAGFLVRLVLAATLSPLYGIYSGFEICEATPVRFGSEEYVSSEKYEVRVRDWDAPGNIAADVRLMNRIRREHPALQRTTNLSFHDSENEHILFYRRAAPTPADRDLLVAVNVDPHHVQETMVHVPLDALGIGPHEAFTAHDLLSGERYRWSGVRNYVRLDPAERVAHVLRIER